MKIMESTIIQIKQGKFEKILQQLHLLFLQKSQHAQHVTTVSGYGLFFRFKIKIFFLNSYNSNFKRNHF